MNDTENTIFLYDYISSISKRPSPLWNVTPYISSLKLEDRSCTLELFNTSPLFDELPVSRYKKQENICSQKAFICTAEGVLRKRKTAEKFRDDNEVLQTLMFANVVVFTAEKELFSIDFKC